jgi:hypothetical protein
MCFPLLVDYCAELGSDVRMMWTKWIDTTDGKTRVGESKRCTRNNLKIITVQESKLIMTEMIGAYFENGETISSCKEGFL